MKRVRVLKAHAYDGRERIPGEEYDMEEKFLVPMAALGNVAVLENYVPSSPKPYISRKDLEAEKPAEAPAKRAYKRRDLKAE